MITRIPMIREPHGTRVSFVAPEQTYERARKQWSQGVAALGTPWTDNSIGVSALERRQL